MAPFNRLLASLPTRARSYSVFTKAGSGRFFNSAKPPVTNTAAKAASKPELSPSPAPVPEQPQDESITQASASTPETPSPARSTFSSPFNVQFTIPVELHALTHPSVTPQDLKLHQFFSLDRPLLQISEPVGSIFEQPSSAALASFPHPPPAASAGPILSSLSTSNAFHDVQEPSPEADADTARQLARALVMSNVGSTVAWEETLKKLGLDLSAGREGPEISELADYGIYLDSTKRKRRSKMKKHKLKKRRRVGVYQSHAASRG
jgi:hypothetical protein